MLRSPLEKPPKLYDLLNRVAAKIPAKWKIVGIQLKIEIGSLESLSINYQDDYHRYTEVFELWRKCGSSPYTWATIIDALREPSIGEMVLANNVQQWVENNA